MTDAEIEALCKRLEARYFEKTAHNGRTRSYPRNPQGAVAAALIRDLKARAEKAERERDEVRSDIALKDKMIKRLDEDALLLLGFARICEENNLVPSSGELAQAADRWAEAAYIKIASLR